MWLAKSHYCLKNFFFLYPYCPGGNALGFPSWIKADSVPLPATLQRAVSSQGILLRQHEKIPCALVKGNQDLVSQMTQLMPQMKVEVTLWTQNYSRAIWRGIRHPAASLSWHPEQYLFDWSHQNPAVQSSDGRKKKEHITSAKLCKHVSIPIGAHQRHKNKITNQQESRQQAFQRKKDLQ